MWGTTPEGTPPPTEGYPLLAAERGRTLIQQVLVWTPVWCPVFRHDDGLVQVNWLAGGLCFRMCVKMFLRHTALPSSFWFWFDRVPHTAPHRIEAADGWTGCTVVHGVVFYYYWEVFFIWTDIVHAKSVMEKEVQEGAARWHS